MKRILIPTDFSSNAWNAICYAMEMFSQEECQFYLLHTYTPAFYRMDYVFGGPAVSAVPDYGVDISVEGLETTLEEIKKAYNNPKHKFEIISAFNLLADEIVDVCREKEIDLVVMGTQGATGAKEIFLGSNTVYVLRKAETAVLAIPEKCKFKEIKNMLFPTGYWTKYNKHEIQRIADLAKSQRSEITLLHIKEEFELNESQIANQKHLLECLKDVPVTQREVENTLMPKAILDFIEENDFGLLTMMNRKHSFMERLLWRQNVDQIGFQVKIPFLVIRDTAQVSKDTRQFYAVDKHS
ncbi:universal stress protein [Poritiphilus flavus]|uniref:Universal stress protein n=1 Tax=Poritiphilus flavus TaxID=2697053 RepID=A0A6L9EI43_9FLAO|nr:universal stress protein [Poritiphilus flavus]NAS14457.1 universal stress protein [Poritiphilus flavus]